MKKIVVQASKIIMRIFPALALMLAVSSVNAACFCWLNQPDIPEALKKYEK